HFQSSFNPTTQKSRLTPFFAASASFHLPLRRENGYFIQSPDVVCGDGLKEKLDAAFFLSGPNYVGDVQLEVQHSTCLMCSRSRNVH
ncbi:hypothetical protein PHJA_001960400, partial [Phtheirospermum japonicum]